MISTFGRLLLATRLLTLASAELILYNSTILAQSTTLSEPCKEALTVAITCDSALLRYASLGHVGSIKLSYLSNTLCCASCASSLATYHHNVAAKCGNVEVSPGFPATYDGDFVWAYQNQTCLKDSSGDFCINQLSNSTSRENAHRIEDLPKDELCSPCMIATFKQSQASGFSNYNEDTAKSWKKIQSICSIDTCDTSVPAPASQNTFLPFNNKPFLKPSVTHSRNTTSRCRSKKRHTTVEGDTCASISKKFSVATGTLAILNGLYADCSNLSAGTDLCLPQTCKSYCVQPNDVCSSIGRQHGLKWTKVVSYNPNLNRDCSNLIVGDTICLSTPAGKPIPKKIPSRKPAAQNATSAWEGYRPTLQPTSGSVLPSLSASSGTISDYGE